MRDKNRDTKKKRRINTQQTTLQPAVNHKLKKNQNTHTQSNKKDTHKLKH